MTLTAKKSTAKKKASKKTLTRTRTSRRVMRKMGAELEFQLLNQRIDTMVQIVNEIAQRQGMRCVREETPVNWTMKTDHCGWELTTPAFSATHENFMKVRQIVEDLRREVCYRNNVSRNPSNTGFHVHVDVSDFNDSQLRNLINVFRTFEPALQDLQHRSRRSNHWTSSIRNRDFSRLHLFRSDARNVLCDHYAAMNFNRYDSRRTIEVRYAGSTVRGRKVINWMQILCFLTEAAKQLENYQYNECGELTDLYEFMRNVRTGTWLDNRVNNLIIWMERRHRQLYHRQEWRQEREERNAQRGRSQGEPIPEETVQESAA